MKKIIVTLIVVIPIVFSLQGHNPAHINNNDVPFIDKKIKKIKNPNLKKELNKLKKDFIHERSEIHDNFQIEKEKLNNEKNEKMKKLRETYKQKVDNMMDEKKTVLPHQK